MTTTIVQITDLHVVPEGSLLPNGVDPVPPLVTVLDAVVAAGDQVAAVLFTGDLVDSGDPASYRRLRGIIEPVFARLRVPALFAAGNHDDRSALREHLLGVAPSTAPLDHVTRIGGVRVIVLDSTVPGYAYGELTDDQLAWLADELATPAPDGTVLALHHPPLPSPSRLIQGIELHDRAGLGEVLAGSDVRIVLCGHTHVTSAGTLAGIPVWVGASTATTWHGLTPAGGESIVRAPAASRIDLFPDGELLASTIAVGAPVIGTMNDAQIDAVIATQSPGGR
jgi:3',5'-cyclic-AMP phosphodiesterase